jgi:hypothetical protein
MIRAIFVNLYILPILVFSQDKTNLMRLKESEYNSFPRQFNVTQKVFEYYYDIAYIDKKVDSLNDVQKILFFHFVCDGVIDNSGFYSILLETNGEFNSGYLKALNLIGDKTSMEIFGEIVSIYDRYEKWFSEQTNPPALDEESKEFDQALYSKVELLEKKWHLNRVIREKLFNEYLNKYKHLLVDKE